MNLELIRKYLTEFNAWVKGQEVYVMFNNGGHRSVDSLEDFNEDVKYIVLKDSYFSYRKALAEGKTIQFNENNQYHTEKWVDTSNTNPSIIFTTSPKYYRIKPEEPEFKIGDWVIVNGPDGTFIECISGIADNTYTLSGTNICYKSQASKWEPKEDEVCIFWDNHSAGAFIDKFKYLSNNGKYHTERSFWITCMPFTGILPPHMKDNK